MERYYEHLYLENLNKNVSYEVKIEAIKKLGKIKSKRGIDLLRKIALNEENTWYMRINSIFSLVEIGDKGIIKQFLPLKSIENEDITEVLIMGIGKLKAIEYIDELEFFINSKNKDIKKEVINTLSRIDHIDGIKLLLKYYNDRDVEIKDLVKFSLKNSEAYREYLNNINEEETLNILTIIPKDKAEVLIEKHFSTVENVKILKLLIGAIGELKFDKAITLMKELYETTKNDEIKLKIVEALENFSIESKKDFLAKLVLDENRDVRAKALWAMDNHKNSNEILKILIEKAGNNDEWWMIRKIAIMMLGNTSNGKYENYLLELLEKEEDKRVIRTIIQQLGEIGSEKSVATLENYLEGNEIDIKKVSVLSLSKLGDKKILEILLKDETLMRKLMPESLKAIVNYDDTRVISILSQIIKERDEKLLEIAITAVAMMHDESVMNVLIDFTLDKSVKRELRAKSLMVLASYQNKSTKKLLKKILNDIDEWWMIKKVALVIIGEHKIYEFIPLVTNYAVDFDDRLAKSAKEVAGEFFKEFIIPSLETEKSSVLNFVKEYSKLI